MNTEPILSSYQAKPLIAAMKEGKGVVDSSINLNRLEVKAHLFPDGVRFSEEEIFVPWDLLHEIASEERRIFTIIDGKAIPIQVFSEETGWVRTLCATPAGPPTTLISGIPMHRIKDIDPMKDTMKKMQAFGRVSGAVLDTATGLGYTAIAAAKHASKVTTIELDPAAIEIAKYNPWSAELFFSSKIEQVIGDSFAEIAHLPTGAFTGILHDPPTMSLGGELYSQEFYDQMFRVIKRGGRLFHYIGDPQSGIGKKVYPGVMKRLSLAGFKQVTVEDEAHGVSAVS